MGRRGDGETRGILRVTVSLHLLVIVLLHPRISPSPYLPVTTSPVSLTYELTFLARSHLVSTWPCSAPSAF